MKMKKKKIKDLEKYNINNNNNMFSEKEREVSELLIELNRVILDLEVPLISLLPFTWGCKRIRSAIQYYTPTCDVIAPLTLHHGGAAVSTPCAAAPSPATPLSLSLTESDDKAKVPLREKGSTKKLSYITEAKKPNLGSECPMQIVYAPNPINTPSVMVGNLQYTTQYVAFMLNQKCGPPQICNTEGIAKFQYMPCNNSMSMQIAPPSTSSLLLSSSTKSSNAALGLVNNTTSSSNIGIVDLNVSSEELIHVDSYKPLDLNVVNKDFNRVIAAQARQRRIQINKLKNPIGNSQTRYSYG